MQTPNHSRGGLNNYYIIFFSHNLKDRNFNTLLTRLIVLLVYYRDCAPMDLVQRLDNVHIFLLENGLTIPMYIRGVT